MESASLGPAARTVLSLVVLAVVAGVGFVWQTHALSLSLTTAEAAVLLTPLTFVCAACAYFAATG
jgi:hypothetical protein